MSFFENCTPAPQSLVKALFHSLSFRTQNRNHCLFVLTFGAASKANKLCERHCLLAAGTATSVVSIQSIGDDYELAGTRRAFFQINQLWRIQNETLIFNLQSGGNAAARARPSTRCKRPIPLAA